MTEVRVRKPFRDLSSNDVSDTHDGSRSVVKKEPEVIVHSDEETKSEVIKQKMLDKTPKKLKNPSNLQVRIRTGAIYIILTVACVLLSQATTALYLAILSAICAGEFYYMLRSDAKLPNEMLGIIAAALFL